MVSTNPRDRFASYPQLIGVLFVASVLFTQVVVAGGCATTCAGP